MKTLSALSLLSKIGFLTLLISLSSIVFASTNNSQTALKNNELMRVNENAYPIPQDEVFLPHHVKIQTFSVIDKQKLDTSVGEELNEVSDTWYNTNNHLYTYDNNGNLIVSIYRPWDDSTSQWVNWEKNELSYDINNRLILDNGYHWDDDLADWKESSRYNYHYGTNGLTSEILAYYLSWIADTLELSSRETLTYDGSDQLILQTYENWVDSTQTWSVAYKTEYSYDIAGNNILTTDSYFDSIWVLSSKNERTFDVNGNQLEFVYYYKSAADIAWTPTHKILTTYDENGNDTSSTMYYYNSSASTWQENEKSVCSFDANNNKISEITFTWVSGWVQYWKSEAVFNLDYAVGDLLLPTWYHDAYTDNNMRTYDLGYGLRSGEWKLLSRITYSFSPFVETGINFIQSPPFSLYPNPTMDLVYVRPNSTNMLYSLELFNVAGKRVIHRETMGETQFSLKNMPAGIYFMRMSSPEMIAKTQRIIVK